MKKYVSYMVFVMMVASTVSCADDIKPSSGNEQENISNIGFEENPPSVWVKRYPMCDKFLKVKWVDKDKKIGFSKYEIYKNGIKNGHMQALIYLNKRYPRIEYDLYKHLKKDKFEDIFSFIKNGEIAGRDQNLIIKLNDKKLTFWPTMPANTTLADFRMNVCVPYPDGKLMWLAEGKKVENTYNDVERKLKYKKLLDFDPGFSLSRFNDSWIVDFNFDGVHDYFTKGFFYSIGKKYYRLKKTKFILKNGMQFHEYIFPPEKHTCIKPFGLNYLTTDGENYYFSNQCNITSSIRSIQ